MENRLKGFGKFLTRDKKDKANQQDTINNPLHDEKNNDSTNPEGILGNATDAFSNVVETATAVVSPPESKPISFKKDTPVVQTIITYEEDIETATGTIVGIESKIIKQNKDVEIPSLYEIHNGKSVQVSNTDEIIKNLISDNKIEHKLVPGEKINEEIEKITKNKGEAAGVDLLAEKHGGSSKKSRRTGGSKLRSTRKGRRNVSRKHNKKSHNKTR